jgi:hypothetical protein
MCGRGNRGGGGVGAAGAEDVCDPAGTVTLAVAGGAVERGGCVWREPADTGGPAAVAPEREMA